MEEKRQVQILIGIGALLFAGILFYNLFFSSGISFVKAQQPVFAPAVSETSAAETPRIVNVNSASAEELSAALKGIGPVIAGRIVEYREQNGPFREKEALKEVKGIGEKIYAGIEDYIILE